MKRIRVLAMAAVAALALTGVAPGSTPAAHASSYGCYGAGCYGLDPVQQGCYNGAYAANSAQITAVNHMTGQTYVLGTVQIWYSPGCDANWSRAYTNDGSKVTFITVEACAKTYANVTNCSGFPCPENTQAGDECTIYTRNGDNAAYGDMVDGSHEVTAGGTIGLTYNEEDIYGAWTSA